MVTHAQSRMLHLYGTYCDTSSSSPSNKSSNSNNSREQFTLATIFLRSTCAVTEHAQSISRMGKRSIGFQSSSLFQKRAVERALSYLRKFACLVPYQGFNKYVLSRLVRARHFSTVRKLHWTCYAPTRGAYGYHTASIGGALWKYKTV